MVRAFALGGAALLIATSSPTAPAASGQALSFYETRSAVLSADRVDHLAGESYWMARLTQQASVTLVRRKESPSGALDALLAAVSSWLPDASARAGEWVFVVDDTILGARAALRPAEGKGALELQPLEVDRVSAVAADGQPPDRWRPRTSFRYAGFPQEIEDYCATRIGICAAPFAVDAPGRSLLTVEADGTYTTFHIDRAATDPSGADPVVRYLGAVNVTRISPPANYDKKDYASFVIEQDSASGLGAVRGVDMLARRERVAVKTAITSYFQSGTRSAEVDVVLPAGPGGAPRLYTLRFLPGSNDVLVEALGTADSLLPDAGPRSEVRGIPGFPAGAGRTRVIDWLQRRYPALSVQGASVAQLSANVDRAIEQRSGNPDWFQANYGIAVLDADAADQRLAKVHDRPRHKRDGLKAFTSAELRSLEAVLQRMGDTGLALLRGTAFVRQHTAEDASPFGDLTRRVQIAGHTFTQSLPAGPGEANPRVQATVVIYDAAHAPNRFVGGHAPDGVLRVYPPVAQVIAHELAHVISRRAPVQRQFEALIEATHASPFTHYAASNPQTEFFPEAFALYLLDPAWIQANHPKLYTRVQAYARRPRPGAL
jgi:hypothetical protein